MWIDRFLLMCILFAGVLWIVVINGHYRGGIRRLDPKNNIQLLTWVGIVLPVVALIVFVIRKV